MNAQQLQSQLFDSVRRKVSGESSLADELARLLEISTDSAYRRMRGEKAISIEELYRIATHYQLSVDELMNIQPKGFLFQGNLLNPKTHRYDAYLKGIVNNLVYYCSFREKKIYYLCKDTPLFHYFNSREIAAFKYFFWMGTLIYFPEFRNKKVNFEEYPDELFDLGMQIIGLYNQLDSYELWNIESWNSTLHQIEYYLDNDRFQSEKDAFRLYEEMERVLDHLEGQARAGYKYLITDPGKKPAGKYNMYFNEFVLQDNSMLIVLDQSRIAGVPHTAINYMMTRNMDYCDNYENYVQNLIKRSTLISEVSEKERGRYFRRMRERIERRKETLKV
ncbi:MAG TPA: helix-turn-helix domain-containing protein [Chitinophagaceae bacterium]|nr:helix-turn-helix domain-containing protein [Chitinophagaceae bacterium]